MPLTPPVFLIYSAGLYKVSMPPGMGSLVPKSAYFVERLGPDHDGLKETRGEKPRAVHFVIFPVQMYRLTMRLKNDDILTPYLEPQDRDPERSSNI